MFASPMILALLLGTAGIINVEATQAKAGLLAKIRTGAKASSHTSAGFKTLDYNKVKAVIEMLEKLEKDTRETEERQQENYDKFACECHEMGIDLKNDLARLKDKLPGLDADIKKGQELKDFLNGIIKGDKDAIAADEQAIKDANALHGKEEKTFLEKVKDYETNLRALNKAIPALEKGMGNEAFLQTSEASTISKIAMSFDMKEEQRDIMTSFLHQDDTSAYDPKSGEIVGILKQIRDEMTEDLRKLKMDNARDVSSYDDLVDAKRKDEEAKQAELNEYFARLAEEARQEAEAKSDREDAYTGIDKDNWSIEKWEKECYRAKVNRDKLKAERAEQLVAIAEALKLLKSDESREVFKKAEFGKSEADEEMTTENTTEETEAENFLQVQITRSKVEQQALTALQSTRAKLAVQQRDPRVDLLEVALRGGKVDFTRIVTNIEDVIMQLERDQKTDETKYESCGGDLAAEGHEGYKAKKNVNIYEELLSDKNKEIAELEGEIEAARLFIKTKNKEFKELSEQRETDNLHYLAKVSTNNAAIKVLKMAMNRINKAFDPKAFQDAVSVENVKDDENAAAAAEDNTNFLQVNRMRSHDESHHPATGAVYALQALIDLLQKEVNTMKATEEGAVKMYEDLEDDTTAQTTVREEEIEKKEERLAQERKRAVFYESKIDSAQKELDRAKEAEAARHAECDFLLKYYKVRFNARRVEMEALENAKHILNGIDPESLQKTEKSVFLPR